MRRATASAESSGRNAALLVLREAGARRLAIVELVLDARHGRQAGEDRNLGRRRPATTSSLPATRRTTSGCRIPLAVMLAANSCRLIASSFFSRRGVERGNGRVRDRDGRDG